ncbi:MAG TPA: nuclear transport factor 2 family protein [Vicinamibacterales bacterium]|nr:nuclear transport factor 2 family protein [Vicinamibacterales bacterium]
MKKTVSVLSMLLLLSPGLLARAEKKAATPAQAGSAVEQALLDLERKWVAAGLKNDAAALGEILADSWSSVSAEGKLVTRAQALDDAKKNKFTRSELSDMKVRMINADTAVVTGVWTGAGTSAEGQKIDTSERWTDVFAKQGASWKCVASHNTTIKK